MDQHQTTIIRFSPGAICATPQDVVRYMAGSQYTGHLKLHDRVRAAIEQAIHLASPVVICALKRVRGFDTQGKLIVQNGLCLEVPPAERDPHTRFLASCVCSLGEAVENTCRRLTCRGKLLDAMLLDAAGVSLLDALAKRTHEQLRQRAREMQLFAGCPFGPGYQDMPLETQSLLFQLVDAGAIEVRLSDSLVMQPMKSLSFLVTLGAREYPSGPLHKCGRCNLKRCRFRRVGSCRVSESESSV